jgi:apolipoprotein N-acyltransferase
LKVLVTAMTFSMFFLLSLSWLRLVTWLGYVPLVFYLAAFPTLCALAVVVLSSERVVRSPAVRRWLPVLATPAAWVLFEWLRGWFLTGFPWLMMGHALHDTRLAQAADIAGCLGLTFLVVGVNSAIAALVSFSLRRDGEAAGTGWARAYLGLWLALCVAGWLYGGRRLEGVDDGQEIRIGVVQGNVEKNVKHHSDRAARLLRTHLDLTLGLGECDMIVWPETCVPVALAEREELRTDLVNLARSRGTYLLMGAIGRTEDNFYNSAFFLSPEGEFLGRYDKMHLVPFGEFTPLPRLLGWIVRSRVFYKKSFSRGEKNVVFRAGEVPFAVLICFEDVFPDVVRGAVREGAKLLINMTSEGWFGEGGELEQHLAICRLAAIENRTPVVRVANTGISAYIDSRGRITRSPSLPISKAGVDVFVVRTAK